MLRAFAETWPKPSWAEEHPGRLTTAERQQVPPRFLLPDGTVIAVDAWSEFGFFACIGQLAPL